jgi:hypothetical protein
MASAALPLAVQVDMLSNVLMYMRKSCDHVKPFGVRPGDFFAPVLHLRHRFFG